MKDLLSIVVQRIAAEWKTVAYYMDFEIAEVNIIGKNVEMIQKNAVLNS